MGPPRTGAHPLDPRPKATAHPSADTSGVDVQADDDTDPEEQDPPNELGTSSADVSTRRGRGPDTVARTRRTFTDQSVGTARLPDWTRFDIQVSLRNLRSWNPAVIRKEMRKLHLRW